MKFVRICLFALVTGLFFSSCEKDMSFEAGSATGVLTDDGSGDCLPATINGTYNVGTTLSSSNIVDIQVNFSSEGVYDIKTDTVNGYSFRAIGSVSTSGLATIHLVGSGTPTAVGTGVDIFHIVYGLSTCSFNIVLGGFVTIPGTITAKVGAATTATTFNVNALATLDNSSLPGYSILDITGDASATTSEFVDLEVAIPGTLAPGAGTYDVGGTGATYLAYGEYNDATTNDYFAETGQPNPTPTFTITITSITPTRVQGTFSGALYKDGTGPTSQTLTTGTFDVPR